MGLLALMLMNVVLVTLFEVSFDYVLIACVVAAVDIFYILTCIRKIRRRVPIIPKDLTKRISLIVNGIAVLLSCYLLYTQYLSPMSESVHNEFISCSLYEQEVGMFSRYEKLLPLDFKVTMILMSDAIDVTVDFINKKNACETESELLTLQNEMKEETAKLELKYTDLQNNINNICYYAYALVACTVLYKLLWYWEELFELLKLIVRVFKKHAHTDNVT